MTATVMAGVLAALFAATMQTVVHAVLKAGEDKLALRAVIGAVGVPLMLPVCILAPVPTPAVFAWLAASVLTHVVYQLVLIEAYKASDFSVAYPLARGIVPVMTSLLGVVLLGDALTPLSIAGIIAVTGGMLLTATSAPLRGFALIAALAAGLLTATYSFVDASGMRTAPNPVTFICWFFVLEGMAMLLVAAALRGRQLFHRLVLQGRTGVFSGVLTVMCYSASLIAFTLLPLGAASALHVTSVVFSALVAHVALKEQVGVRRASASLLIACGAATVILGL